MSVPLIAAGLSLAGGLGASAFNYFMAKKDREWKTDMANTSHQREVADLRAAGLNPILAAGGAGAPVPTTVVPQMENVVDKAVNSGMAARRVENESQMNALALRKLEADTKLTEEQGKLIASQIQLNEASAGLARNNAQYRLQEIPEATAKAELWRFVNRFLDDIGVGKLSPREIYDKLIESGKAKMLDDAGIGTFDRFLNWFKDPPGTTGMVPSHSTPPSLVPSHDTSPFKFKDTRR